MMGYIKFSFSLVNLDFSLSKLRRVNIRNWNDFMR